MILLLPAHRAERGLPGGLGEPRSRFWRGVAVGIPIGLLLWVVVSGIFILTGGK